MSTVKVTNIQQGSATNVAIVLDTAGTVKTYSTVSVGNATPSSSGAGITFPATQSASTDANTLDDYEEGTWTPSLPNGGTLTVETNCSVYTKIGRQVTVTCYLSSITPTNNSSAFLIGGLPFTIASPVYYGGSFGYLGNSNLNTWLILGVTNSTTIGFRFNNGSSATPTNANYITAASGNDDSIILTLTYFAAD